MQSTIHHPATTYGVQNSISDTLPVCHRSDSSASTWRAYLAAGETQSELAAIRHCTYTGRPLGTTEFIRELEQKTQRPLAAQKGGRPRLPNKDARQSKLTFGT
jgi:hypothetical protein